MKTNDARTKIASRERRGRFPEHIRTLREKLPTSCKRRLFHPRLPLLRQDSRPRPREVIAAVELRADTCRSSSSRPQTFDFTEPVLPDRVTRRMQGSRQHTHRPGIPAKMRYDKRFIVRKRGRQPAQFRVGRCASGEARSGSHREAADERENAGTFATDP